MPTWLIYSLAFCGAVDIVLTVLGTVTKPIFRNRRRIRSQRVRIATLRATVYDMESTVSMMRNDQKEQADMMLDVVASMKDQAQMLKELTTWAKQVRTVTDLWEKKFKETGPDGP